MDNQMMIFEDNQVEVFELNDVIYFNPYHVGNCLGLTESAVRKAISNMNKNQSIKLTNSIVKDSHIRKLHSTGELFLTESGVYKLVFRSNKPKAEKFTDWVTDDVLPTIRKEGIYVSNQTPELQPKQNLIKLEKQKLEKAITTVNYLISYVGSKDGSLPDSILDNFTTTIQAVNIDITDYLRNMTKLQQIKSH